MIWFTIAGLILLAIYEVVAAVTHRWFTISQLTWHFVGAHPQSAFLFGLVIGLLLGHLFL